MAGQGAGAAAGQGVGAAAGQASAGRAGAGRGGGAGVGAVGAAGQGGLSDEECAERLTLLDRGCSSDADCRLGAWNDCTVYDRTQLLGLSAGALAELGELAELCGRPSEPADCPGEGGGISPPMTEDGLEPWLGMTAAVACFEGRCASYTSRCGRELCGNGTLDQCRVTQGNPPKFEPTAEDPSAAFEQCDGDAFGGSSCETFGYAGGSLRCIDNSCSVDESGCAVCAQPSAQLLDCRTDAVGQVQWLAIAASEAEVAVLYSIGELRLARFSPDLTPLGEVVFETPGAPVSWGTGALARAEGAWVAVATRIYPAGYSLLTLRDGGEPLEEARSTGEIVDPILMARPGGPPMLVYGVLGPEGFGSSQALTITDDLKSYGAGHGLGSMPVMGGAFVRDAYLLTGVENEKPVLLRLDLGATTEPTSLPFPELGPTYRLHIGSDGDTAYVVHEAPADSYLLHVDADGAALDDGLGLGGLREPSAPVVHGAGAYVVTSTMTANDNALALSVVGGSAQSFVEGALLASPAASPRAVAIDGAIVIAFTYEGGLGLARFQP